MEALTHNHKDKALFRKLIHLAYANIIIWMISMIALVFVMNRFPGIKGFFVIFAGGMSVSISLLTTLLRNRK